MASDYTTVKALAAELGRKVTDLLALSPQNDPFYAGSPADVAQAEWFAQVLDGAVTAWKQSSWQGTAHLRRVHYWAVGQPGLAQANGKPYENTQGCWQYLCQAAKVARYLGLVDIGMIADHKNPAPHVYSVPQQGGQARVSIDVPELSRPGITVNPYGNTYGFNVGALQPYHLEVWVEKSTVNDVLQPICRKYHANLVTGEGEMSLTSTWALVTDRIRTAGKPTRLFYISDFDPAGLSMPRAVARKVEWILDTTGHEGEVKVYALALTAQQVQEYKLPRTPIKETERRAASFEDVYGEGAVELDGLEGQHPGELGNIVSRALSRYWSNDAVERARELERAMRQDVHERLEAVTERYKEEIAALRHMQNELNEVEWADYTRYEPHQAATDEVAGDPPGMDCLFDSGRDYLDQIAAYNRVR